MIINTELKKYIENKIMPQYVQNDLGHNKDHIEYVIKRSLFFAKTVDNINLNMVYTIAAYHDLGHNKDAANHEKVSSEILLADQKLTEFFKEEEIKTMAEAVYDHRASLVGKPRSIYGEIVSSADRNVTIEIPLKRTYAYRVKHNDDYYLSDIIYESRQHLLKKYGNNGYANEKMYFEDLEYSIFLKEITKLINDEDLFIERYLSINNINDKIYKIIFERLRQQKPNSSLDELVYETFLRTRLKKTECFDKYKQKIIVANNLLNENITRK